MRKIFTTLIVLMLFVSGMGSLSASAKEKHSRLPVKERNEIIKKLRDKGEKNKNYKFSSVEEQAVIEEQQDAFEEFENSAESKPQPDKDQDPRLRGTTGTYPTRKGVMLVTDASDKLVSFVGHAAMVSKKNQIVESMPSSGVRVITDNFKSRYNKVWAATTYKTAAVDDAKAADWAVAQKGKPYNPIFFDSETTSKFYCSQLVYKAIKTKTGVSLKIPYVSLGIVTPADLLNSSKTYTVYSRT